MEDRTQLLIVSANDARAVMVAANLGSQLRVHRLASEAALQSAVAAGEGELVLLDPTTPGVDARRICREIGERLPVICLVESEHRADELLRSGAVDVLPWSASGMLARRRVAAYLRATPARLDGGRLALIQRLGQTVAGEAEDGAHVRRMSGYARILGRAAGLDEAQAEMLARAASIYDIGKVGIPERILRKPGRLTADEWVVMKTHTEIGARLIDAIAALGAETDDTGPAADEAVLRMAGTIAVTHHEKWDGSGYPRGLAGEEIPLVGRIVAICDVFDAVTTERPYKSAWEVDDAIDLLDQGAGTHFDPKLVPLFLKQAAAVMDVMARHGSGSRYASGRTAAR